jgi:hypothetical protein
MGRESLILVGLEAGCAPGPVWTLWRRGKSWLYLNSNSDPSVFQSLASRYTDLATEVQFQTEIYDFIVINELS